MTVKDIVKAYVEIGKRLDAQQSSEATAVLFLMENDVYEIVKAQHDIMQLRFNIRTLEKKKSDAMKDLERLLKETNLIKLPE